VFFFLLFILFTFPTFSRRSSLLLPILLNINEYSQPTKLSVRMCAHPSALPLSLPDQPLMRHPLPESCRNTRLIFRHTLTTRSQQAQTSRPASLLMARKSLHSPNPPLQVKYSRLNNRANMLPSPDPCLLPLSPLPLAPPP
jgi:hypothetical protein